MTTAAQFGEPLETYLTARKFDSKGREIGFAVGLNDNGTDFHAWVQCVRRVKGEWRDFGTRQRSKKFSSQAAATRWAYSTARERIAKLAA
jgi:hypothetical protein